MSEVLNGKKCKHCETNNNDVIFVKKYNERYTWITSYKCNDCNGIFFHCKKCSITRATRYQKNNDYLMLERGLQYHENKYHLFDVSKPQRNPFLKGIIVNYENKSKDECFDDMSTIDCSISRNNTSKYVAETYDRKESLNYFQTDSSREYTNCGPSSLVGIALCDSLCAFKHMIKEDVDLHLLTTKFLSSLSRNQREDYSLLLNVKDERQKMYIHHTTKKTLNMVRTRLATTDSDFRNWYLRGVRSICNILPRPNVSILDNHSYVSVRQCIADYLGKGNLPSIIPSKPSEIQTETFHSNYCQEIRKRAAKDNKNVSYDNLMIITAVQWSDDFDPNSFCKNNRGSVWIKTLTFFSSDYDSNKIENTYPLSIGLKKDNHDIIEQAMINELFDLKSGEDNIFYSKALNKNVHVHFEIIVSLGK